jgi:hypothetical protein
VWADKESVLSLDGGTYTLIIWTVKLVLADLALAVMYGLIPVFHAKRIAHNDSLRSDLRQSAYSYHALAVAVKHGSRIGAKIIAIATLDAKKIRVRIIKIKGESIQGIHRKRISPLGIAKFIK